MLDKLEEQKEDMKADVLEFLGTLELALEKVGSLNRQVGEQKQELLGQ